jgi:predicted alpha/beta superfamily hydrolase
MKQFLLPLLLLWSTFLFSQPTTPSNKPVEMLQTETFHVYSDGLQTDYQIKVYLPESYAGSSKRYPVLYLLDGDHAFAMATDIVTYMQYGNHIPEMIIVSPAYGDKNGPKEGGKNYRQRDFSPFKWSGQPSDPSAEKYFAFLKDTIVARIDQQYRTKPQDRTLWGYSRSGLLVLWALFEKPGLFNKYIAIDTGFHLFEELEKTYQKTHQELEGALYIGYGSLGNKDKDIQFMERLKTRKYEGFRYKYEALQGEKHLLIPSTGLALGLEFVFGK